MSTPDFMQQWCEPCSRLMFAQSPSNHTQCGTCSAWFCSQHLERHGVCPTPMWQWAESVVYPVPYPEMSWRHEAERVALRRRLAKSLRLDVRRSGDVGTQVAMRGVERAQADMQRLLTLGAVHVELDRLADERDAERERCAHLCDDLGARLVEVEPSKELMTRELGLWLIQQLAVTIRRGPTVPRGAP